MTNPNEWSQHNQRVSQDKNNSGKFFRDQHGREWHAEVERSSGDPCGPLRLARPNGAPFVPDGNFITIVQGRRGDARVGYDIEINYPVLAANVEDGWRMYSNEIAQQRTNNPQLTEKELVRKVGKPAMSPRIIALMEQGDEYLLGFRPYDPSNPVDRWAKAMVDPERSRSFVDVDDGFPADLEPVVPTPKRTAGRPKGSKNKVLVGEEV